MNLRPAGASAYSLKTTFLNSGMVVIYKGLELAMITAQVVFVIQSLVLPESGCSSTASPWCQPKRCQYDHRNAIETIGSYGVEDSQLGNTSRAYTGVSISGISAQRGIHTGAEETSDGRLLLDIIGGGASTVSESGRHFASEKRGMQRVNASGTCACKFYLSTRGASPDWGPESEKRRIDHYLRNS